MGELENAIGDHDIGVGDKNDDDDEDFDVDGFGKLIQWKKINVVNIHKK